MDYCPTRPLFYRLDILSSCLPFITPHLYLSTYDIGTSIHPFTYGMGAARYTVRTEAVSSISYPELLTISTRSTSPCGLTRNRRCTTPWMPRSRAKRGQLFTRSMEETITAHG